MSNSASCNVFNLNSMCLSQAIMSLSVICHLSFSFDNSFQLYFSVIIFFDDDGRS